MANSKVPTLSIGIPAHNEGQNIDYLLRSIQKQKEGKYKIQKIFVVCDGCTDNTEQKCRVLRKEDKRIQVISDGKRKGKASRLNQIYKMNTSDYILNLDGDVVIKGKSDIEKMISIFLKDKHACVVAAHQIPVKPEKGFIAKIIYFNNLLWNEVRVDINGGDHIANLYGSASMLTHDFSKSFIYPVNVTSDEEFLYILAKKREGFRYCKTTQVLSRPVETITELRRQGTRYRTERFSLIKYFGPSITELHNIPKKYKVRAIYKMIRKYPMYTLLAIGLNLIVQYTPSIDSLNEIGMWDQAQSSKRGISI